MWWNVERGDSMYEENTWKGGTAEEVSEEPKVQNSYKTAQSIDTNFPVLLVLQLKQGPLAI